MATQTQDRREAILAGALACFTEAGYDEASIACICRRSKSSVGSVYHHFGDKEGLAAALYVEGIRRYQHGLEEILDREPEPGTLVRRMVGHHIAWVRNHPDWARFLFRTAPLGASDRDAIRQRNAALLERLGGWIVTQARAGGLVPMEPGVFLAVTIGPCHELARRWLAGDDASDLAGLVPVLSAAACRAVGVQDCEGGI